MDAKVEGRWCKLVVDTGSNITIVRPDVIEASSSRILPTKTVLRTVTGETAPVKARGHLRIALGNCETKHDVWVADIVDEGIIGLDYLMANNCQVDLGGKLLYVGNDEVPLFSESQPLANSLSRIVVRRTVAVLAMSEAIIPGELKRGLGRNVWATIEPMENSKCNLLVARTLVDVTVKELPVRVMNLTNDYISLKRGTEIALCGPVTCVSSVKQQSSEEPGKSVQSTEKLPAHLVELYHRSKSCIGQEHEVQLIELLTDFQDVFSSGPSDFGTTNVTTHKVDVGDATPIKQPARRVPLKQREEVNELLEEMRSQGVIEPSQSPWSSPVVLVQKKDGSKRFCVDYRKLNEVTKRDSYPLPRVDTTLDAVSGSSWFSTLDLEVAIGKSKWQKRTKKRPPSQRVKDFGNLSLCHLALQMLQQHSRDLWNRFFKVCPGQCVLFIWMTLLCMPRPWLTNLKTFGPSSEGYDKQD